MIDRSFADCTNLYSALRGGVVNMIERFFDMRESDAWNAVGIYTLFETQTRHVQAFFADQGQPCPELVILGLLFCCNCCPPEGSGRYVGNFDGLC